MKKSTLCSCFTWIAFVELNFTAAFLLIKKTLDVRFVGNIVCTRTPFFSVGRLVESPNIWTYRRGIV